MIDPVRLRYAASRSASQLPRYPPARSELPAVSKAAKARVRNDAVQARISPRPAARKYAPRMGRHQK